MGALQVTPCISIRENNFYAKGREQLLNSIIGAPFNTAYARHCLINVFDSIDAPIETPTVISVETLLLTNKAATRGKVIISRSVSRFARKTPPLLFVAMHSLHFCRDEARAASVVYWFFTSCLDSDVLTVK